MGDSIDFWKFEISVALLAMGIGFASTPATTAITTSLPQEKQGVASAVNDVAREFGSALGIAILGAGLNDHYRNSMKTYASTISFPPQVPAPVAEKLQTSINDFAVKSAGFTRIKHPEQTFKDAWQFIHSIWDDLVSNALRIFAEGSTNALRIAGIVALFGALAVGVIAPNKKDRENLIR
jgi:MFS family permease